MKRFLSLLLCLALVLGTANIAFAAYSFSDSELASFRVIDGVDKAKKWLYVYGKPNSGGNAVANYQVGATVKLIEWNVAGSDTYCRIIGPDNKTGYALKRCLEPMDAWKVGGTGLLTMYSMPYGGSAVASYAPGDVLFMFIWNVPENGDVCYVMDQEQNFGYMPKQFLIPTAAEFTGGSISGASDSRSSSGQTSGSVNDYAGADLPVYTANSSAKIGSRYYAYMYAQPNSNGSAVATYENGTKIKVINYDADSKYAYCIGPDDKKGYILKNWLVAENGGNALSDPVRGGSAETSRGAQSSSYPIYKANSSKQINGKYYAYMYSRPSSDGSAMATYENGTLITVLNFDADTRYAYCQGPDGKKGYILKNWLVYVSGGENVTEETEPTFEARPSGSNAIYRANSSAKINGKYYAYMYSRPSSDGSAMATYENGTPITVLNYDADTRYAYCQGPDGKTGYILKNWLVYVSGGENDTDGTDRSYVPRSTSGNAIYRANSTKKINGKYYAYMYHQPNSSGEAVATYENGALITVLDYDADSKYAYCQGPDGKTGYILKNWLLATDSSYTPDGGDAGDNYRGSNLAVYKANSTKKLNGKYYAYMYSQPNSSGEAVATYENGTEIKVIDYDADAKYAYCIGPDNRSGYILKNWLSFVRGPVTATPTPTVRPTRTATPTDAVQRTDNAVAVKSSDMFWVEVYYDFLASGKWLSFNPNYGDVGGGPLFSTALLKGESVAPSIALYDMNNDGLPELFTAADSNRPDYNRSDKASFYVFEAYKSSVGGRYGYLGSVSSEDSGTLIINNNYPGVYSYVTAYPNNTVIRGYYHYMKNNGDTYFIKSDVIYERNINANNNEWGETYTVKNNDINEAISNNGTRKLATALFSTATWDELVKPYNANSASSGQNAEERTQSIAENSDNTNGSGKNSKTNASWQNAYYELLSSGNYFKDVMSYDAIEASSWPQAALKTKIALYDMNKDGVPELFMYVDDALAAYGYDLRGLVLNSSWNHIYTFTGTEVKYLDSQTVDAVTNSQEYPGIVHDLGTKYKFKTLTYYYLSDDLKIESKQLRDKNGKVVSQNSSIYNAVQKNGTRELQLVLFSEDNWKELVKQFGVTNQDEKTKISTNKYNNLYTLFKNYNCNQSKLYEQIEAFRNSDTLFDYASDDVLKKSKDGRYNFGKFFYKLPDIKGHITDILFSKSETEQLDALMESIVKENYSKYTYVMLTASNTLDFFGESEELLYQYMQTNSDIATLSIPVSKSDIDALKLSISEGESLELIKGLPDGLGEGITIILGSTKIICDSISDVYYVLITRITRQMTLEYLETLDSSVTSNSSIHRVCEKMRKELCAPLLPGMMMFDQYKKYADQWKELYVNTGWDILLDVLYKNLDKSFPEILSKIAGVLKAIDVGNTVGKLITLPTGLAMNDGEKLELLYIVNFEIECALSNTSKNSIAYPVVASLYLTSQEKGIKTAASYYSWSILANQQSESMLLTLIPLVGPFLSLGKNIANTQEIIQTIVNIQNSSLSQVGKLNDIRKTLNLPVSTDLITNVKSTLDEIINFVTQVLENSKVGEFIFEDDNCKLSVSSQLWYPEASGSTTALNISKHKKHNYTISAVQYNSKWKECTDTVSSSDHSLAKWLNYSVANDKLTLTANKSYAPGTRMAQIIITCDCGGKTEVYIEQKEGMPQPDNITLTLNGSSGFAETSNKNNTPIKEHLDYIVKTDNAISFSAMGGLNTRRITVNLIDPNGMTVLSSSTPITSDINNSVYTERFNYPLNDDSLVGTYTIIAYASNSPYMGDDANVISVRVSFKVEKAFDPIWPIPASAKNAWNVQALYAYKDGAHNSHFKTMIGNTVYSTAIDIGVSIGTDVLAIEDGKVIYADYSNKGYGNLVMIQHTNGMISYYGHLSKISVSAEKMIKKGEKLGESGQSGNVTGPHLHIELGIEGKKNVDIWRDYMREKYMQQLVYESRCTTNSGNPKDECRDWILTRYEKNTSGQYIYDPAWQNR